MNQHIEIIEAAKTAFPSKYYDPNWKPRTQPKKVTRGSLERAKDIQPVKIPRDHNAHVWAHYSYLRKAIIENEQAIEIDAENLPQDIKPKYLKHYVKTVGPYLSQEYIFNEFKRICPNDFTDILKDGRKKQLVTWRHALFHALKRYTGQSYPQIGRALKRDHTTAIHAVNSVNYAIECGETIRHESPGGVVFYTKAKSQTDYYQWKKPSTYHKTKAA